MKLNGVEIDADGLAPRQEDARWWGPPAYIAFSEEIGNLVVQVTKRRRKGDFAVAGALVLAGVICFSFPESRPLGFGLLFAGTVYLIAAWRMTGTTMTVSPMGISSEFSGMFLRRRAQVTWEKAGRLTYLTQTRNRPRGLYARRGMFSYTCLVPYISSDQTAEVIAKIYERFPQQKPIA